MLEHYTELIKDYSKQSYRLITRKPAGQLKHPFIVPGSNSYSDCLWDWDSWLTDVAVRQIMRDNNDHDPWFRECEKGCILNYVDSLSGDGWMPISITPDDELPRRKSSTEKTNIHKPCLAQHAAFLCRIEPEDRLWVKSCMNGLEQYIVYYEQNMFHPETGLFFWLNDAAIGVDNDPCTFYRPDKSSTSIFLNCLMLREYQAMAYLCEVSDMDGAKYVSAAKRLKDAINEHLWDERNGFYYSADINLKPIDPDEWLHSGRPRHWHSVLQKIDCWSGFMAMWAQVATPERAERMVRENLLKPELFCGTYGVRTLAKTEKMYCIVASGNPSCWLGPVWGISNYMVYRGLMNYGYTREARDLAEKTITLFGRDLEGCGELHEYYDPDTGRGVNNQGFQSWNLLVNNMIAEQLTGDAVKEF